MRPSEHSTSTLVTTNNNNTRSASNSLWPMRFCLLLLLTLGATTGSCMTVDEISVLRQDTRDLFYHGYDSYMRYAFPEDEVKPISCTPQTRNRENPADIGLNDVLGNYSLTLIDSLSTLAILASGHTGSSRDRRHPLRDFQNGVEDLVELYGDGTDNKRCGTRACGFDLDSKVQVFETNIRGLGGLLSAHLFAMGELPMEGYKPVYRNGKVPGIRWRNGFTYNGQLLHLAYDLGKRLLPAFETSTGIPYPRVNLRTGIPFYRDSESGVCRLDGTSTDPREIVENCAAGAGSLVLEFSTLSRLTGDPRFERLGKRAFWAIWQRRSAIDLLGNGIDAETGQWTVPALSGIGAGIDSFFEYSLKSHILLSGLSYNTTIPHMDAPESFLEVWQQAHAAVKRHIYNTSLKEKHPYYAQVDTFTGALRYHWIDNLSAYYPGLLVLAGELDEAIESHLLWSALWTRYSTLPERWNTQHATVDPNFKYWVGRPEFIESNFHLHQATKDPYYLHVGEMAIRDIRRRCWTKCGWADLSDVSTGEQRDRMESFFLGETAKYLYLLFTEDHPLNKLDRPVVFTTEGHPLLIPDPSRRSGLHHEIKKQMRQVERNALAPAPTCPVPKQPMPLTVSNTANRSDLFHAGALAQLHMVPINPARSSPLLEKSPSGPGISYADVRSPSNYTFYPWTLPQSLIPSNGFSTQITSPVTSSLTFPNLGPSTPEAEKGVIPMGALHKILDGVLVNSLSNLRLNMVQQPRSVLLPDDTGVLVEAAIGDEFRIHGIASFHLGRDEKVILTDQALKGVNPTDPHFTRIKDLEMVDLVLDIPTLPMSSESEVLAEVEVEESSTLDSLKDEVQAWVYDLLSGSQPTDKPISGPSSHKDTAFTRQFIPAILPTGAGAAPFPALMETDPVPLTSTTGRLPFGSIFHLDSTLCDHRLPSAIAKSFNILVIYRGGCSFNEKLANIPSFAPSPDVLQLLVIVSVPEAGMENPLGDGLTRPLLDQPQLTPTGFERRNPIAMVMVDGTQEVVASSLERIATGKGYFDEKGRLVESKTHVGGGLAVKRRYWFESMGVPIVNLLMA
ncbi:glycoside hydrolase family 47 [Lecanosticta acicola]|uniref:alpha-1,2-Mannosidase n=1 Tax=Lecanosticta acicola TaxID=111012 RepID=A0AAI9ECP9_9PEZI|nr:glycoside hydrolase family 47 [Lecanosticta acicola]